MSKKALILLHGALGAAEQFDPWIEILEQDFVIYRFDFEGHGRQAFADRSFAIEHFAENLADYISDHQIVDAQIFGYSMGGYVAMYLALQQPGLIARIFTFATKLDWNPASSAKEVKMLDVKTILEKVPKFADMLAARHSGNDWQIHLQKTASMMLALGDAPRLSSEDFQALDIPIRIAIGDRDTMVTLEETIAAYRHLPNAQLLVIPNTPHPIEKIDRKRIAAEILAFFGE